MKKKEFLSIANLAQLLGVSLPTARKIAKENFQTFRFTHGATSPFFVKRTDVQKFLKGDQNAKKN